MRTFYNNPVIYHSSGGGVNMTLTSCGTSEYIDSIMKKDHPNCTSYVCLEEEETPKDTVFIQAWIYKEDPEPHIEMDIQKALNIQKNRLRYLRQPKFSDADLNFQRALEENEQVKMDESVAQKQALRDIPNIVDEASAEILAMDPSDIVGITSALKLITDDSLLGDSRGADAFLFNP